MLELYDLLILLGAGAVAGFLGGLLGIGGGIIMIPALFSLLELWGIGLENRMHIAVATSLLVIVGTSISSARAHHKRGSVDWAIVKSWVVVILLGSLLGSFTAQALDSTVLIFAFVFMGVLMAIKMILPLDDKRLGDHLPSGFGGIVYPGISGWASAILGIGGGIFNVPYMTLYGVPIQRAVGTAAFCGLISSLGGGAGFLLSSPENPVDLWGLVGYVHLPSVLGLVSASVIAAPFGAAAAHAVSKRTLSVLFGIFIVIAITRLLFGVL